MSQLSSLVYRHVKDSRWLLGATAACVFLFCWLHVVVNAEIDMSLLSALLDRVPNFVENLAPVPLKDLLTYPVRLAIVYEEPLIQFMMVIWCIARSSDVVAGEISRGTMELLLSQPIRRSRLIGSSTSITLAGVLILCLASFVGTSLGIATSSVKQKMFPFLPTARIQGKEVPGTTVQPIPMSLYVRPRQLIPCVINYAAIGIFLTGLGTLMSAYDRHRWRVIGLMTGFYVIQHMLELAGRQWKWGSWLGYLSVLRAYDPARFVSLGLRNPGGSWSWIVVDPQGKWLSAGPLMCDAMLIASGAIFMLLALRHFRRCDVPAPI